MKMKLQPTAAITAQRQLSKDRNPSECLACPNCGQTLLESTADRLECRCCQQSWPLVNGIPHFVSDFPYWGEIPQEQMQEVNRLAQAGNWRDALLESKDASVQRASTMILNLERANWHCLVDLPPTSRVLDLGAGTGTTSHALARHYREVVALEPVLERVQFMQQRFSQENISNVQVVRSSLGLCPLPRRALTWSP